MALCPDTARVQVAAMTVLFALSAGLALGWVLIERHAPLAAYDLPTRINPNTAPVGRLVCLPGIGPVRALAMIAYREAYVRDHPGQSAFKGPEDLCRIKGLGPAVVGRMASWLTFADSDANGPPVQKGLESGGDSSIMPVL